QLLGYLTWRDTRAALILFVRQTNVTSLVQKTEEVITSHPRFKRTGPPVGGFPIYVLHHDDDVNREIHVALVVVPVHPPNPGLPPGGAGEQGRDHQ
ncbi:MAG TPA: hypothetical protein VFV02_07740, partial [Acidimicrobiales bacterium]|nr:hypothetical protein [Acidimicrobiales bacterium]